MAPSTLYSYFLQYPAISTDTRNIQPGSLFFALKGDRFNGNRFATQALENGASYAVVDEKQATDDHRFLYVDNVLSTLQQLAKEHRSRLTIPVIGITGTNGKTTTKELIQAVLSQEFLTYATKGNLNNHIGVPLTILSITPQTEVAIVEMGANHVGEIAFLCDIAQPTHGLITNVGRAHLEGFGNFEGVKKAKGELYDYLAAHNGTLFLQSGNVTLREMAAARAIKNTISYGTVPGVNISGELVSADPLLNIQWATGGENNRHALHTQLTGAYNTENILAAVCIGHHFGLSAEQIGQGIGAYKPTNNRSQLIKTKHNSVICDYYNANASSMAAALENLSSLQADRKAIVLGDMFEMGDDTYQEHLKVVKAASAIGATRTLFVGKAFYEHRRTSGAEYYETTEAAKEALTEQPIENALVLLKASRGMAFEKLVEAL